jgi:hypothetical protein
MKGTYEVLIRYLSSASEVLMKGKRWRLVSYASHLRFATGVLCEGASAASHGSEGAAPCGTLRGGGWPSTLRSGMLRTMNVLERLTSATHAAEATEGGLLPPRLGTPPWLGVSEGSSKDPRRMLEG